MIYFCPVCGYPGLDETPYDSYGFGSHVICPCCWTEYGFDDGGSVGHVREDRLSKLRTEWIDAGMQWRWKNPPVGWDPIKQLENLKLDRGPDAGVERYQYRT